MSGNRARGETSDGPDNVAAGRVAGTDGQPKAGLQVAGRSFSVVGAGKSGLAAANLLARHGGDVLLVEQRADATRPEALDARVAFRAGSNDVRPGDVAVLSPGIPEVSPLRAQIAAQASDVIGEIELFYQLLPAAIPVLAVTGTDGKSTVTTMLGDIIAASGRPTFVGGNLGNPLCDDLDRLTPEHAVVAEVSCFQLTTCRDFRPRVAVVTNIAPDHTDYHGSFAAYQAAKRLIWRAMTEDDVLVINGDDAHIAAWTLPTRPTIRRFSLVDPEADARVVTTPEGLRLEVRNARSRADARSAEGSVDRSAEGSAEGSAGGAGNGRSYIMMRHELPLLGRHNVQNALAAAQMAVDIGISPAIVRQALSAYRPLPHRLAIVGTFDGVTWVDDSKATSPNAASAGLNAMETPVVMMLGGSSKDADFSDLAALVRRKTRAVVCFGATREAIAAAIGDHPKAVVATLPEAIAAAKGFAKTGDTVLFSPACASFDQFRGYAHRGEVFTQLVTEGAGATC